MALFKFRKGGDEPRASAPPAESIEAMRRRARHRLIGAVVLVLAGVIGFPLLFDTQPRPVAVDIPIEIPDRNKAKPLAPLPEAPAVAGKVTPPPAPVAAAPAPVAAPAPAPVPAAPAPEPVVKAPEPAPAVQARAEKPAAAEPQRDDPTPSKARPGDGARAQALLEGKAVEPVAAQGRFVVQVGAFAEQAKAREARLKLERAGIKTYTHVAETSAGRRIRVRAGPFATRAEAERAAAKIKGLDLPAAILSL